VEVDPAKRGFPAPAELAGLVVATAMSLRRHHAQTLIFPMSLTRDAYRAEVLGGLADAGEEVLHVFLADVGVLRERLNARAQPTHPGNPEWDRRPASSASPPWMRPRPPLPATPSGRSCCARTGSPPATLTDQVPVAAGSSQGN
jgi:hypothetical protein